MNKIAAEEPRFVHPVVKHSVYIGQERIYGKEYARYDIVYK